MAVGVVPYPAQYPASRVPCLAPVAALVVFGHLAAAGATVVATGNRVQKGE